MRQLFLLFVTMLCFSFMNAQPALERTVRAATSDEREFRTLLENPITPIKNQNRSGTCWAFATCAFFESELLRLTGKEYDLSEMFVANKDYMDGAIFHVRLHGDNRFSQGGSADDVMAVIRRHGICPEEAMPKAGSMVGDTLANFNEFFSLLEPYMEAVARNKAKKLSPQWKVGFQSIVDAYIGKCPETFVYEGKTYTPRSFADALGLNLDDYVSITSFTHHPFYSDFIIEAPYKWRRCMSRNVPLDEMMSMIDKALEKGYTVCWGGDVSDNGFTRNGIAVEGDDKAPTQEERQQRFDNHQATYDHVMLIYGIAEDQHGHRFYKVKNSWGHTGKYDGIWMMSRNYIAMNTTYVVLNKHSL